MLSKNKFYTEFVDVTNEFKKFKEKCIPLCAAENVMSDFSKAPLISSVKEKYVMGGVLEYIESDNFIGGEKIYPYYGIINKQCKNLFMSEYADARTLTGMNSVTTLLMSLTSPGDTIAISMPDSGGHASLPDIAQRLALNIKELSYDYEKLDFNYNEINDMLFNEEINLIIICISDVVNVPDFSKINNCQNIPIIYDATQTLGLIAGKQSANPLKYMKSTDNFVLMGATHKTIPGPSCSLIMTRNMHLARVIENKINPTFLRNTQMNEKLSLILTLLELEYFGKEYSKRIIENARNLALQLKNHDFQIMNSNNNFTSTHQVFFSCSEKQMIDFYDNCQYYNVTLNFKTKKLFKNSGIRIGVQEISRYGWGNQEITILSDLLKCFMEYPKVYNNKEKNVWINNKLHKLLSKKTIHYTFDKEEYENTFKNIFV